MTRLGSVLLLALIGLLAALLIKKRMPEIAAVLSVCVGAAILLLILPDAGELYRQMTALGSAQSEILLSVTKITAMGFLGQWGAQICRDSGENHVADQIETALKVMILLQCLPYFTRLFSLAEQIG